MSTVEEIVTAIEKLLREEFFLLTGWLSKKFAQTWDAQIEDDVSAGRLDELALAALEEHRARKTAPFPGDTGK